MNKSKNVYIALLMAVLFFGALSVPLTVQASPNVVEWLNNEEPAEETPANPVEAAPVEEKSLAGIIVQLVLYTLLIVAMIYGLIKFLAARQKNLQPNQAVKLMGGTQLGNNKSLQVVKIGGQMYLIGVGDEITLIKEFSDAAEINSIEKDFEQQQPILSKNLLDFTKKKIGNFSKNPEKKGFDQLFKQSLNKQKAKQQVLGNELGQEQPDKEGRPL
ncbi:flagellar protein [Planococcus antarcticus DSM 14505]|uniref:Flagellar biosynthesis protein FliZ n=1 Tax=Planococcus antarcticus DSM 14505 TaxID=1185653 RepID=A0A1C7DCF7_9BACL|nr:flagellar biosynthetic protein FliO [Planococcus antarcticus]ANU09166.1 flagellar biosynthesis protein FliZ [Planococcus antarcticus DSM 14505]EIM08493.1 flagellar protein [Planococcus antarcticus DSM 14505]